MPQTAPLADWRAVARALLETLPTVTPMGNARHVPLRPTEGGIESDSWVYSERSVLTDALTAKELRSCLFELRNDPVLRLPGARAVVIHAPDARYTVLVVAPESQPHALHEGLHPDARAAQAS